MSTYLESENTSRPVRSPRTHPRRWPETSAAEESFRLALKVMMGLSLGSAVGVGVVVVTPIWVQVLLFGLVVYALGLAIHADLSASSSSSFFRPR
jgi:hypothetical protein